MKIEERLWQRLLIATSAIALLFVLLYLASLTVVNWRADFPFTGARVPGGFTIAGIASRYASDAQGLRSGDVVELDRADPTVLAAFVPNHVFAGTVLDLPILRGGDRFTVHFRTLGDGVPYFGSLIFVAFGDLWMLVFAFAIGMRNSKEPHARLLCAILLVFVFANSIFNSTLPGSWYTLLGFLTGPPGMSLSALLFAMYALRCVPNASLRKVLFGLTALAVVLSAIASVGLTVSIVSRNYTLYSLLGQPLAGLFLFTGRFAPARVVALVCAAIGIASSTGAARGRLAWATVSITPWYLTSLVITLVPFGVPLTLAQAQYVNNVSVFLAPLGLTYAALSRRVFDIGFVVNRALVFGVMSLVVVSCFVLLEWGLSEWVKGANHVTSISVNVVLALGLGVSMRYIHLWVDRFVDNVFFRKRHEDERELRRFAREAGYISDAKTLVDRAVEIVERCADASFVGVILDDGAGRFGDVNENDRAIVALRSWSERVDLERVVTELPGEFAYPMVVRGRLVGAFIVGPKRSGESYAPDESDAIAHLAIGVGTALDALGSPASDWREAMLEQLRALPEAVADRLRTAAPSE